MSEEIAEPLLSIVSPVGGDATGSGNISLSNKPSCAHDLTSGRRQSKRPCSGDCKPPDTQVRSSTDRPRPKSSWSDACNERNESPLLLVSWSLGWSGRSAPFRNASEIIAKHDMAIGSTLHSFRPSWARHTARILIIKWQTSAHA